MARRLHLDTGWAPEDVTVDDCPGCALDTHNPCEDDDCTEPHWWVLSESELPTSGALD